MAEPFKNLLNQHFLDWFTNQIEAIIPQFDSNSFAHDVFNESWEDKELKDRISHISTTLNSYLKGDYLQKVNLLLKIVDIIETQKQSNFTIEFLIFPDFVEKFGLDHPEFSLDAIEKITNLISCEFAIRPYLNQYPVITIERMLKWSNHDNPHVRRLASEGCRPRLPWANALPQYIKNPEPIIPILENLKSDPSKSVRLSVANNLNDISKDNPHIAIELAKNWHGHNKEVNWVVKHGCRTLLRNANSEIMDLFDFSSVEDINVDNLNIENSDVKIGELLKFKFSIRNNGLKKAKLRIEYGIYFVKKGGSRNRKLFKISERECLPGKILSYSKTHSFRNLTTRKHYCGEHLLSIVVNGQEMAKKRIVLL